MGSEKKIIGIDIDDVIVHLVKHFYEFYNKKFGKELNVENHFEYNFMGPFSISEEEAISLIKEFYFTEHFDNLDLIEASVDSIHELSKDYEIFFITSRHLDIKDKTENFLQKLFPNMGYTLIFSGEFWQEAKSKVEICEDVGVSIMIEDNEIYALDCAKKGIKVFLLDKPWNQNYEGHKNIMKVKGWKEILEKLR